MRQKTNVLKDSINTHYIVALCTAFRVHGRFLMYINKILKLN